MDTHGPDPASEAEKKEKVEPRQPPGEFLSPDLASDTARFLKELRNRLRKRADSLPPIKLGRRDDRG